MVLGMLVLVLGVGPSIGGCDDPVPGPIGGLVFTLHTMPATKDMEVMGIDRIVIETARVEVISSATPDFGGGKVVVDTQPRTIVVSNKEQTRPIAQYQVPVGAVEQIRIFPSTVTVHRKDSTSVVLDVPSSDVPSWAQSGWKIVPADGNAWPIAENALTGVRAEFAFDERVLHNKGHGYKIKPTVPGVLFAVNPPPGEPGVYVDQITVVFQPGTTQTDVDTINGAIGATVLIYPIRTTVYRMQLPVTIDLQGAYTYYAVLPQVVGVLPAVNLFPHELEDIQDTHDIANLPLAWPAVAAATGGNVGDRGVRVAIVDTGVDIAHHDLFLNIAINQDEIPPAVAAAVTDTDGDGVISFVDLNDAANAAVAPAESNGNGFVDAEDMLADGDWANGDDTDGNLLDDDLTGWDFFNNVPGAFPDPSDGGYHGTFCAGIAGAIGDNGRDIVGTQWIGSIVPIRATNDEGGMPLELFIEAATYADDEAIDVMNTSFGLTMASESADLDCAVKQESIVTDIPQDQFDAGVVSGQNAFRIAPFVDGMGNPASRVLYVFSAGNESADIGSGQILQLEAELLAAVIPDNVLTVGSADETDSNSDFSNYGAGVVDIWGPGQDWESLVPDDDTDSGSGTSFASPAVAGIAALAVATDASLIGQPADLRAKLLASVTNTVDVESGDCEEANQPLLDALQAVTP
jgi:hypothetical protein